MRGRDSKHEIRNELQVEVFKMRNGALRSGFSHSSFGYSNLFGIWHLDIRIWLGSKAVTGI